MNKKQLIQALDKFVTNGGKFGRGRWKGQLPFAKFLAGYLRRRTYAGEKWDHWDIDPYMPKVVAAAFEELRTGQDKQTVAARAEYEADVGHLAPDLMNVGVSPCTDSLSAVQTTVGFLLKDVMGQDYIDTACREYFFAQRTVIQQMFDCFVRRVYQNGMFDLIEACAQQGMELRAGETTLLTYVIAGRVMFTFSKTARNSESVSFVAEDHDPDCLSAGLQSIHTDFLTVLRLIQNVIEDWPADKRAQKRLFKSNPKISMV